MNWYPAKHVLHTYHDLSSSDTPVCCSPESAVFFIAMDTIIKPSEVSNVSFEYGSYEIVLDFNHTRKLDCLTQHRQLRLCSECEKDLMWSRIQNLENALKSVGKVF